MLNLNLSTHRQPPVPAGGTVIYHCPGLKSFQNKTDWTVTCSADTSEFEWTPPLLNWPECGCDDSAVKRNECPQLHSIQTYYAHSEGMLYLFKINEEYERISLLTGAQASTVIKIDMTSNVTDWKVR